MKEIHSTVIAARGAVIADGVRIGPYTVIDDHVEVGPNCDIDSGVRVCRYTRIGVGCRIHHGAVLGGIPQDMKFAGEETILSVGDGTVIREYVTVNRGTAASGSTIIGRKSLLLAYVHVAHDCRIGDHVILSNAVNLGGHVEIEDFAGIGGMVPVHQFVRIGRCAFVAGGYRVSQDVPPYILAGGEPLGFRGLNYVGLHRCQMSKETIIQIEKVYRIIYRSGLSLSEAIKRIQLEFMLIPEIAHIVKFMQSSQRGFVR
jgi:UDP-N-acetylglucosamine acyltransferase